MSTSVILAAARAYVRAGLSVIPIGRWTKVPSAVALGSSRWAEGAPAQVYLERPPTDAELVAWFATGEHQLGIVGGPVSGGLLVLDFEREDLYMLWYDHLVATDPALAAILRRLPVVRTGKGHHVYLRMEQPIGHEALCTVGESTVLVETQGAGCYVVAPPSEHPQGGQYAVLQGDICETPYLETATAQQLIDAARFPGLRQRDLWPFPGGPVVSLEPWGLRLDKFRGQTVDLDWYDLGRLGDYLSHYAPLLRHAERVHQEGETPRSWYDEGEEGDDGFSDD
jgi:hypothetical protein